MYVCVYVCTWVCVYVCVITHELNIDNSGLHSADEKHRLL